MIDESTMRDLLLDLRSVIREELNDAVDAIREAVRKDPSEIARDASLIDSVEDIRDAVLEMKDNMTDADGN